MHSLTMNWNNSTSNTFNAINISHSHGTDPTFTPPALTQNSSVFVDQSVNLGPGPAGNYTWAAGAVTAACYYDHPSTSGQTTVTVTPNGCKVSFDNKTWSTTSITTHPTGHNITQAIYIG